MRLSKKEKREIGFILSAVLIVAFAGVGLTYFTPDVIDKNIAGQAVTLDPNAPSYEGMLYLLENNCAWVAADGNSCDVTCGDDICLPLEESCPVELSEGYCRCCEVLG